MTPYTYLIGWRELDTWYYGVRYANKESPKLDLWVNYFTSSKHVKAFRDANGEPDVIRVHKEFTSREDACEYEVKFLTRMKVETSDRWLNMKIAGSPWRRKGTRHTPDSIAKMSAANIGRIPWNLGVPHPESTREKISKATTGRKSWIPKKQKPGNELSLSQSDFILSPSAPASANKTTLTKAGFTSYADFRAFLISELWNGLTIDAISKKMGIDPATGIRHTGLNRDSPVFLKNYRRAYTGIPKSKEHKANMKKPKSESHAQTMRENWHSSRGLEKGN